jgi:hypothetical protein
MPKDKSVGAALVLTFLFGPLGLFYSSILGGIVMLAVALVLVPLTLGFAYLLFIWPICMLWGAAAASAHHSRHQAWLVQDHGRNITTPSSSSPTAHSEQPAIPPPPLRTTPPPEVPPPPDEKAPAYCQRCGDPVGQDWSYCRFCGARLASLGPTMGSRQPSLAPQGPSVLQDPGSTYQFRSVGRTETPPGRALPSSSQPTSGDVISSDGAPTLMSRPRRDNAKLVLLIAVAAVLAGGAGFLITRAIVRDAPRNSGALGFPVEQDQLAVLILTGCTEHDPIASDSFVLRLAGGEEIQPSRKHGVDLCDVGLVFDLELVDRAGQLVDLTTGEWWLVSPGNSNEVVVYTSTWRGD